MRVKANSRLAIFDTFKTGDRRLTGEARRQRAILAILAGNANPAERTRTGIAQKMAKRQGIAWKNIYSGIFRDLDEVLLPMGIAEEEGRLPLKRGPKALQEKGIPYYHLTRRGLLIALSIEEVDGRDGILEEFFAQPEGSEGEFGGVLKNLARASPTFTYSVFQRYVRAFCNNEIGDILPLDLSRLKDMPDDSLAIQKEILVAFLGMPRRERDEAMRLLEEIA